MIDRMDAVARFVQLNGNGSGHEASAPSASTIFRDIEADELAKAATAYRDVHGVASLVCERGLDLETANPRVRSLIASACGYEDFDALKLGIAEIASTVDVGFESIAKRD